MQLPEYGCQKYARIHTGRKYGPYIGLWAVFTGSAYRALVLELIQYNTIQLVICKALLCNLSSSANNL